MSIVSVNPHTGAELKHYEETTDAQLEKALARAAEAARATRKTTFAERAVKMRKAADLLEARKDEWARLATSEMGKTFKAAKAEVEKSARVCRYYADNAEKQLADESVTVEGATAFVRYQPLGVVLAVMPWNFPFWQVLRFAAPALMAGNVGLLKHASNVPGCALEIEKLFVDAGFGEGAFQTLLIGSDKVASLIEDDRVQAVTLTGSEPAGRSVAAAAGKAIKKVVLELGGSDPFVVMPSADVEKAVETAVTARTMNNGQSCIAAKRFIVHADVYDAFVSRFVEKMKALKVGDPMEEGTAVGPLATSKIRDELDAQVQKSVAAGAKCLVGGKKVDGPGFAYLPTVLVDIPDKAPAYRDELFGPVASVFSVKNLDEAIALANDTGFGLGSSAWTKDPKEEARFIDELEAGSVFINAMVASDPPLPFGGIKRSGLGRELGAHGIREFMNVKTVRKATSKT